MRSWRKRKTWSKYIVCKKCLKKKNHYHSQEPNSSLEMRWNYTAEKSLWPTQDVGLNPTAHRQRNSHCASSSKLQMDQCSFWHHRRSLRRSDFPLTLQTSRSERWQDSAMCKSPSSMLPGPDENSTLIMNQQNSSKRLQHWLAECKR